MKILLVEDDPQIADFIITGLKQAGYSVDWASTGGDGFAQASTQHFDALVLDIMLPGFDGLTLIKHLKARKIVVPILILSSKAEVEDRVKGLNAGADDYMVKPFSFTELLARVHALIRRNNDSPEPTQILVGDLKVDLLAHEVFRGDKKIDVPSKEFQLLVYLLHHKNRVVSKTMILENVWNFSFNPNTNIVETRMSRLRDKVDKPFEDKLIHTVRGVGYVVREPETSA